MEAVTLRCALLRVSKGGGDPSRLATFVARTSG